MKKLSFFVLLFPIFLIFASCGSTGNVAATEQKPVPQTAEEAVTQKQDDIANEIADEINAVSPKEKTEDIEENPTVESKQEESSTAEVQTEEDSTVEQEPEENSPEEPKSEAAQTPNDETEKVSDEDSNLNREREDAPMTDEKNKVSEYQIFEEPEVKVYDLKEEPEAEELPKEPLIEKTEQKSDETPSPAVATAEVPAQNTEIPAQNEASPAPTKAAPAVPVQIAPTAEDIIEEEEVTEEKAILPSRSVTLKISQYLDVVYPGKGWVYIGESEKDNLFNYFGRKLGTGNTTFALRAKKSGTTLLHFYKNDALTGEYIDDYLEVTVLNERGNGRVKAPSYADIVPAKPQRRIDRANENLSKNQTVSSEQAEKPAESKKTETKTETKSAKAESTQNKTEKPAAKTAAAPQKEEASSPISSTESDVKTVIQTTDAVAATQATTPASQTAAGAAASQSTGTASQTYNYTPTSSESTQNSTETDGISSEPSVISETAIENTTSVVDESLLEKAKKDFADKKYEQALNEAQEYYSSASTRLDEALYLLGQIWESESSVKNIRSSVDSYDSLIKLYPASKFWKKAKNRSIYLKRFYIDIR